jgi:hypothetical protein
MLIEVEETIILKYGTDYIPVDVYRNNSGDSTNNGVSNNCNRMYLFKENLSTNNIINFITREDSNINILECLQVQTKNLPDGNYTYTKPVIGMLNSKWHMFGGNYAYTSDSRFADILNTSILSNPIAIHDRVE